MSIDHVDFPHHPCHRQMHDCRCCAGSTVGAGILALPAVTAPAGFLPSTATMVGVWMLLAAEALLLAEANLAIRARQARAWNPLAGVAACAEQLLLPRSHLSGDSFAGQMVAVCTMWVAMLEGFNSSNACAPQKLVGCVCCPPVKLPLQSTSAHWLSR